MTAIPCKNRTILISGASVAGPALAYWLSRYGFKPTIVEKAPGLREGGYAIDIRGEAQKVAERMGIKPDLQQAHTQMQGMIYVDKNSKPLAQITPEMMAGGGDPDIEFLRGDLTRLLYNRTKDSTEYIWGDSIASCTEQADGVLVTFERSQPGTFDLVVGADGVHSNVRARVFGEESQFTRELGYYVAIFTTANHLNLQYQELIYRMPGKVAGMYSTRQNTEAKALFYFTAPQAGFERLSSDEQKQILADQYAGEGWEIPTLLEGMWHAPDFYFDSLSLVQMDSWSKGRVVLVGDAGYCATPLSGQGTSLALVGAYVLAGELAVANGDYQSAFAMYEKEMQGYVTLNQKIGADSGKMLMPKSRSQIWFNNQMIRMLPYMPWKDAILKAIRKPYDAITLKHYESVLFQAPAYVNCCIR
jgi:2-polyprenyl-6-methoxyphenol hydroxylase-like FAD-dependent oxidoreductase